MGLDMYLKASIYTSKYTKPEKAEAVRKLFPEIKESGNLDSVEVHFEIGYWRKANHIHKWFVDNVQDGEDDCREYYVERKKLEELREICKQIMKEVKIVDGKVVNGYTGTKEGWQSNIEDGKVIANSEVANELLPTQSGFFFGSTDYDQWYVEDVENTIEIIDKCLILPKEYSFYYQSSW